MRRTFITFATIALGVVIGFLLATREPIVHGAVKSGSCFAAVPSDKGGWDLRGPYERVRDWPKPMSQLPRHEKWGWGAVEGVFAESPNRIFIVQRGELPVLIRAPQTPVPQFGPSLSFPTAQVPFRNVK